MVTLQSVDPAVSRRKFEREISDYRSNETVYRQRGWILSQAEFPTVVVVVCAAGLTPPAIITGVSFDYSNYDAEPPSVRFVNPFTLEPYRGTELPTTLKRQIVTPAPPGFVLPGAAQAQLVAHQPLLQFYGTEDVPFLCLAGVREYHAHPAHSGDSWDMHRTSGAGRLVRLLDVIDTYGVRPISGYNVELVPRVAGFIQKEVPA